MVSGVSMSTLWSSTSQGTSSTAADAELNLKERKKDWLLERVFEWGMGYGLIRVISWGFDSGKEGMLGD